jgi:hypothetical protein
MNKIPNEILVKFFSYIPEYSPILRSVCRNWKRLNKNTKRRKLKLSIVFSSSKLYYWSLKLKNGNKLKDIALINSLKYNLKEIYEEFLNRDDSFIYSTLCDVVAQVGNLQLLKRLISDGYEYGVSTLVNAITSKNIEMIKYLIEDKKIKVDSSAVDSSCKSQNKEIIQYIFQFVEINGRILDIMHSYHINDVLIKNGYDKCMFKMIKCENIELIRYTLLSFPLMKMEYRIRSVEYTDNIYVFLCFFNGELSQGLIDRVIQYDRVNILKYLIEEKNLVLTPAQLIDSMGKIKCLEYLSEKNLYSTRRILNVSDFICVKYMIQHDFIFDSSTLLECIEIFNVLSFDVLLKNGCEWNNGTILSIIPDDFRRSFETNTGIDSLKLLHEIIQFTDEIIENEEELDEY